MGMVQRGEDLRLAFEPADPFGVARRARGEGLDRDLPIQTRIARAVDFPHPASAQRATI